MIYRFAWTIYGLRNIGYYMILHSNLKEVEAASAVTTAVAVRMLYDFLADSIGLHM